MTSLRRKNHFFLSELLEFTSVIIVVSIGCTAAGLNQRPLNAAVEMQGQTSFVCSSDIGVPHWVHSSNGKSNRDMDVRSDHCSVSPEDGIHFQTEMNNNTCTLIVRNATKALAGVYTCIDGSQKSDRFSALLTVLDPYPAITMENQSKVFDGQTLEITCITSYAGPVAPAPPLAPSVYFSTSNGQRVSNVSVLVTSEQVLAFFSVAAKSPMLPSFTCNVFFPTVNETKQQYATNTPNNSYSRSSPAIPVSPCETGDCVENKQNVSTSPDDEADNDWRSNASNQSVDNATGGENNETAMTSAIDATTSLYPSYISGNESTSAPGNNTSIDADELEINYRNKTDYFDTDFPDGFNKNSGRESSENSTDIESERNTNITYDTTVYNNATSNSTGTISNSDIATNGTNETATHYEIGFPDWKESTSGIESSNNASDIDGIRTTNSTFGTSRPTYYQTDLDRNVSDSADIVVDSNRTTNYTNETTRRYETNFPTLNTTVSGKESSANSINVERITKNAKTTTDNPIVIQDWNSAIGPIAKSTNYTDGGFDDNENVTSITDGVSTYGADDVSHKNASSTRSVSNNTNYLLDNFLNSIFGFNETFVRIYRNEAPHLLKASFSSIVIAESIFLFFVN